MTHVEMVDFLTHNIFPEEWAVYKTNFERDAARARINRALSALRAKGLAVVPREATDEMCMAGAETDNPVNHNLPIFRRWWSAMRAAGEIRPGEGGNE